MSLYCALRVTQQYFARNKNDYINGAIGGMCAGAVVGVGLGKKPTHTPGCVLGMGFLGLITSVT